jgi:hypothetical protein
MCHPLNKLVVDDSRVGSTSGEQEEGEQERERMMKGVSLAGRWIIACACACAAGSAFPANSWAEGCPNESIRLGEVNASRLPDCRAYEQVSPIQKNLADAIGGFDSVQASPNGERVTFASVIPFPDVKASAEFPLYLSEHSRSADMEDWSTSGLEPLFDINGSSTVLTATEDLSKVIVFSTAQPPLAPVPEGEETAVGNYYIFNVSTGKYEFFLPGGLGGFNYVDSTPDDSRILFQTPAELVPCGCKGLPNLYEWHEGRIGLIAKDAVGGPTNYEGGEPGAAGKYYTQYTISADGSRIVFTSLETGQVYVYSRSLGKAVVVSPGSAEWRAATPDGSYVFYIENDQLYRVDVKEAEGQPGAGRVLIGDEVIGLLGVSDDGLYAYYAAKVGPQRAADINEWHEGRTTIVVETDRLLDVDNWEGSCGCNGEPPAEGEKSSRVSASGEDLLMASSGKFTDYDNAHQYELYLYHAPTAKLVCVSCNPTGTAADTSSELLKTTQAGFTAHFSQDFFLTRNLSEDGNRVFFQTEEALLPQDDNHGPDVYEWDREGDGSCGIGEGNGSGGCLYLITPGNSGIAEAYFGNADAEGKNVFFFTRQALVTQDQDYDTDLYDARVGGGMKSQNEAKELSCVSEEACRGASSPSPQFNVPSSTGLAGSGNLPPTSEPQSAAKSAPAKQKANHKRKVKRKKRAVGDHRTAKYNRGRPRGKRDA